MITDENKDRALCEYELKVQELKQKLAIAEKALELLAEEFIDYDQSLKEECIIEGGILTDIGYEMTKKFLIDKVKFNAKEIMNESNND